MSIVRTLRYGCPPDESITLVDLKTFLDDAFRIGFGEGVAPRVTIQNSESPSKVGTIQRVVIEDVLD